MATFAGVQAARCLYLYCSFYCLFVFALYHGCLFSDVLVRSRKKLDSWYLDGVESNGAATGPVPGESFNLFRVISVELERCFSEHHWLVMQKLIQVPI